MFQSPVETFLSFQRASTAQTSSTNSPEKEIYFSKRVKYNKLIKKLDSKVIYFMDINLLTSNDDYSGRTAPLTSKCCILYIYSTNIGTEYFKHGIYSHFSPLQNAVCLIILMYLVPVLFTFYIQDVLKLKKNNSGAKRLI